MTRLIIDCSPRTSQQDHTKKSLHQHMRPKRLVSILRIALTTDEHLDRAKDSERKAKVPACRLANCARVRKQLGSGNWSEVLEAVDINIAWEVFARKRKKEKKKSIDKKKENHGIGYTGKKQMKSKHQTEIVD